MFQFRAAHYGWLEAQVHRKVVLKCVIKASGEPCVMIILITQQQKLFVTCWDTNTRDSLLVTAMLLEMERFGWTTFNAMEQKLTLQIVNTTAGVFITVFMVKTFQFLASQ